uniref:CHRD domain-containing protein n=1 Tax=Thermorudis sp. TaxID=1969470 RepID=A0A7C2WAN6_9BACT
MRRVLFALTIALLGALFTAVAASAQETVTVNLSEQSDSGQSGTATLTAMGNQTRVTIQLSNPPGDTPQPAHIHPGTCANLNPQPQYPLNNVVNGTSETVVDVPLANLLTGNFAINVHKSGQEISVYVACGDIPARAQVAPATGQPRAGTAQLPLIGGLAALALVAVGAGLALRRARA